jgi:hypothetical protein
VKDTEAVLRALQHRYLIRDDPRPGGTWWELSHDLLVAPIQEDNRSWRVHNLAAWQVMADQWQRSHHDARYLLRPADLRTARLLSQKSDMSEMEKTFLDASRKAVAAEGKLAKLEDQLSTFRAVLVVSILINVLLIIQLLRA